MTLHPPSEVRDVAGVSAEQAAAIRTFLQGAVYCWCKNRPGEWFALRNLMGGDNYYWEGTPMIVLYRKHEATSPNPVQAAGQDAGWLLKAVIDEDPRAFETREGYMTREYRWAAEGA
jgi:hypothetical protein